MAVFTVSPREPSAKAVKLRRQGVVPMSLIQRDHSSQLVQAPLDAVKEAFRSTDGHGMLEFKVEGEKSARKAIIKNVEHDPLKRVLLTVTLQEVAEDDTVKMDVSVISVGTPAAFADHTDLILEAPTNTVKLRGRLSDIPEHIEVDVSNLQIGEHINAGDVQLPEGIDLLSSPDATLFSCKIVKEVSLEPETVEEAEELEEGATEGEGEGQEAEATNSEE